MNSDKLLFKKGNTFKIQWKFGPCSQQYTKVRIISLNQLTTVLKISFLTQLASQLQISLETMLSTFFEKHTHTSSALFRTSQRRYLVSRRVDKKSYSLVCQLILVKSAPHLFVLFVLCVQLLLYSLSEMTKWVQLNRCPTASDPLSDNSSEICLAPEQPIFKRQFFAFDAILGCSYRTGLKRRITRWLLVILQESEL